MDLIWQTIRDRWMKMSDAIKMATIASLWPIKPNSLDEILDTTQKFSAKAIWLKVRDSKG